MRVLRTFTVALLLVSASVACTSHTAARTLPTESPTRSSAPSPSLIAPAEDLKAKVDAAIAAYRGLWAAYIAATRHPDPNDAGIRKYATGDALHVFDSGLASMQRQGLAGKGTVVLHPKPVDIEPAAAPAIVGVSDCVDSAGSHLYKVDGSTYHDTKGGKRQVNAMVELRDGVWKVTEFAAQAVGTC